MLTTIFRLYNERVKSKQLRGRDTTEEELEKKTVRKGKEEDMKQEGNKGEKTETDPKTERVFM